MSRTAPLPRLAYITSSRLPTEKAHGFQISRMCEAFALQGLEAVLTHPHRHQPGARLRCVSVFDYYGIRPVFQLKPLPSWDVVPLDRVLPNTVLLYLSFARSLLWSLYAALLAGREQADLYYTRDTLCLSYRSQAKTPCQAALEYTRSAAEET